MTGGVTEIIDSNPGRINIFCSEGIKPIGCAEDIALSMRINTGVKDQSNLILTTADKENATSEQKIEISNTRYSMKIYGDYFRSADVGATIQIKSSNVSGTYEGYIWYGLSFD